MSPLIMHIRAIYPGLLKASLSLLVLLLSLFGRAQDGTSINDAIPAGTYSSCTGNYFNDSRNNDPNNWPYYSNTVGHSSPDVWYTVTLQNTTDMDFSLCGGRDFDTYIRLFDSNGYEIANDDDGCDYWQSRISYPQLPAGTYYLVVEGYDTNTGNFNLSVTSQVSAMPGLDAYNAIDAGGFSSAGSYSDIRSNDDPCLNISMSQPSPNLFYKFTLSSASQVALSHCGSSIDTYLWLLNSSQTVIASNDDNSSSPCLGTSAYLETSLNPGTYYVVSGGKGYEVGAISTAITVTPLTGAGAFSPSADRNFIATSVARKEFTSESELLNSRGNPDWVQNTVQYFDGLGRPEQTVQVKGSGDKTKDVVVPNEYDSYSREARKYLPYAAGNNDGSYKVNALSEVMSYYQNGAQGQYGAFMSPFAQSVFENSPLNRITEQGAPGDSWQPVANSTAGHTVKMVYGSNAANEVERWDLTGAGATSSLSYTPNELYKTTTKDENWISGKAGTTEEFKDKQNRVVLKRTWESESSSLSTYYVYDDLGNLRYVIPPIVSDNTLTENNTIFNQYLYGYHYDSRNRMIEKKVPGKGWEYLVYNDQDQIVATQDANQRNSGQWLFTKYDALARVVQTGIYTNGIDRNGLQGLVNGIGPKWESRNQTATYSNNAFPTNNYSILTTNYYDDYTFGPYQSFASHTYGLSKTIRTTGLLTGSITNVLGSSSNLQTVNYYDENARPIETFAQNHLGGTDRIDNKYNNITGELTYSTRYHTSANGSITIANRYEYDHMGRKAATYQKINSDEEVLLSALTYTETGQLKDKKLHNAMQSTNYSYNPRGWLKSSISPQFSMELKYEDGSTPQYNGNIANQYWGTPGNLSKYYSYTYDKLNRLGTGNSNENYNESISYDVMGNITSLSRSNYGTNSYHSYDGNRLMGISGFTNGSYAYDANGNMTTDGPRGIAISYNLLNLPAAISGSQNISYTYTAAGTKLQKQSASTGTFDYIGGIQYKNNAIEFVQTEEGRAVRNGNSYSYEYTLIDHLGNNRVSFDIYNSAVRKIQEDDYYPFGLNYNRYQNGDKNKYLYNRKELQEELNEYDYGARFYDPVLARWNVVDPKAELYFSHSTYAYVANNPIILIDPNGMEIISIEGGVRFTEEDAQNAHKVLSGRSKSVYMDITRNSDVRRANKIATNMGAFGSWAVFGAENFETAIAALSAFQEGSLNNLVLETHGKVNSKGISHLATDDSKTNPNYISTSSIDYVNSGGTNATNNVEIQKNVADLKSLTDKVTDGGRFILASCFIGQGNAGKALGAALNQLTGNRLNTYLATDFITTPTGISSVGEVLHIHHPTFFKVSSPIGWLKTAPTGSQTSLHSISLSTSSTSPVKIVK